MKIATRGDGTESDVVATLLSHLLSVARASGHGPPQSQVCPTASPRGEGATRSAHPPVGAGRVAMNVSPDLLGPAGQWPG
jgi:hypothetical protein